jgi:hypothetical protein
MNIDLKLGKLSEQIRYRNGQDIKRVLQITAHEARELEETESIQEQELKVVKKISTLEHLNQLEIDHQTEDGREHSEELKKRAKGKDRQSDLERLRAAARAVQMANRLKKAEEEEMAELRRIIAAGGRNSMPQAQPSKNKRSYTQEDESEDEKDWRRKEQEELGRKANSRRSPARPHGAESFTDDEEPLGKSKMRTARHGALESSTDDEEESPRKSKTRKARRKLSRTPPHSEESEDQSTDAEKSPPPNKGPKIARKPQNPPGSPPRDGDVDDLMAQFQRFGTPLGSSPHGSRSGSPMYYPPYGYPLPSSMAPNGYGGSVPGTSPQGSGTSSPMYYPPYGYPSPLSMAPNGGYGGGVPGPGSVVNTGVGNITNSVVQNVGNDNSVKKVYRK